MKKPSDFYYTYDFRENLGMPYCDDKIAEDKGWIPNLEDDKYLILGGKWDLEDAKKTVYN